MGVELSVRVNGVISRLVQVFDQLRRSLEQDRGICFRCAWDDQQCEDGDSIALLSLGLSSFPA